MIIDRFFFLKKARAGSLTAPGGLPSIWAIVEPLSLVLKKGFSLNGPNLSPWGSLQGPGAPLGPYPLSPFQKKKKSQNLLRTVSKIGIWFVVVVVVVGLLVVGVVVVMSINKVKF